MTALGRMRQDRREAEQRLVDAAKRLARLEATVEIAERVQARRQRAR